MLTDADIAKLVSKFTAIFVTKEDIKNLEYKIEGVNSKVDEVELKLGNKINEVEVKLGKRIDEVNDNTKILLQFANGIDETTEDHEKRLKRIEAIPAIAHEINK